ncbi:hypothetical protein POVCU2_0045310 [Plasmodium ovale curtisi]|uniref:Uncharacterized protein n=1 Tax=Plasmodium ovale curtisi TaxID=864141 RepID=A0A1A8WZX6_PLAOA|nr:hypothetical protein POVCU2_0045310 [Plasmodium ovale curtisi]SBS97889.1 hypothetical protein POVCU1_041800 [Plasmodium ovale curtisi]
MVVLGRTADRGAVEDATAGVTAGEKEKGIQPQHVPELIDPVKAATKEDSTPPCFCDGTCTFCAIRAMLPMLSCFGRG